MLFISVDKCEVPLLKAVVAEHDPDAIMVISDVNEALGGGLQGARGRGVGPRRRDALEHVRAEDKAAGRGRV